MMDQAYCDALRFAIDYEKKGEEYYRRTAGETTDKFAASALTFLADEEVEHIRKIEQFNNHLLGQGEFDIAAECQLTLPARVNEFLDRLHQPAGAKPPSDLSDTDVYEIAMKTEKQGFEMYSSVCNSSTDERLKRFFGFLAQEEQVHHNLLAASKKYLEDPSYYFEEGGGWLFS